MIMKDDLGYRNYVPEHVNKEAMASLTKVRPPLEQALSDIDERLSVLWSTSLHWRFKLSLYSNMQNHLRTNQPVVP